MCSTIIYERVFPKDPVLEELEQQRSADAFNAQQAQYPSFSDMMADVARNTAYIPRPYRIRCRKRFINAAIAFSDFYKIDLTVTQNPGMVSATFYFDPCAGIRDPNHIMGMADEFEFLTNIHGHEICMTLNYYTHKVTRRGIVISPK